MKDHKHTFGMIQPDNKNSNIDLSLSSYYIWNMHLETVCNSIIKSQRPGPCSSPVLASHELLNEVINAVKHGILKLTDSKKEIIKKYLFSSDIEILETL